MCQINFIYNCHINFENCQIPDFRFRRQAKSVSYATNFHSNVQKTSMYNIKTLLCKIIFSWFCRAREALLNDNFWTTLVHAHKENFWSSIWRPPCTGTRLLYLACNGNLSLSSLVMQNHEYMYFEILNVHIFYCKPFYSSINWGHYSCVRNIIISENMVDIALESRSNSHNLTLQDHYGNITKTVVLM